MRQRVPRSKTEGLSKTNGPPVYRKPTVPRSIENRRSPGLSKTDGPPVKNRRSIKKIAVKKSERKFSSVHVLMGVETLLKALCTDTAILGAAQRDGLGFGGSVCFEGHSAGLGEFPETLEVRRMKKNFVQIVFPVNIFLEKKSGFLRRKKTVLC